MVRANARQARGRGYYSRYLAHYTKRNATLLFLGALFVAGVAAGTLLVRSATNETLSMLFRLIDGFLEKRRMQDFGTNFLAAAGTQLAIAVALFVCGFCAVAQPLEVLAPLLRGLGFGFSVASLYTRYGTAALGPVGVLMLPGMTLSTVALLLCCRESMRLSGVLLGLLAKQQRQGSREAPPLGEYFKKYFIATLLYLSAAALEAALYAAFGHRFIMG